MPRRLLLSACIVLALSGCAAGSGRWAGPGPHRVAKGDAHLYLGDGRSLRVHVAAPAERGTYPVIVFSHGARCWPEKYAAVTDRWAGHGYVVLAPNHLDSPNNPPVRPEQFPILIDSRIDDLARTTDAAAALVAQVAPGVVPDASRMAVAGHSFGGMLAQIKAGQTLVDPASKSPVSRADPRYRAALVMSGVGPMPPLADGGFAAIRLPLLASGGTLDLGNTGGPVIHPWEWRMSAYALSPPGDRYSIVVDRGDHYWGGLMCRDDRDGPPDPEAAEVVGTAQLAFLDAWLRGSRAARRFLDSGEASRMLGTRARFERR